MADRPHCANPGACPAKTPGKHCPPCAARTPECIERRRIAQLKALEDPEALARRRAGQLKSAKCPDARAKRSQGLIAALNKPDVKKRHIDGCKAAMERRMADPAEREALRQVGLNYGLKNLRAPQTEEARQRAALAVRDRHLDWCPEEFRDLNASLKRKGYLLAERQALIAAEVARFSEDAKARRAIAEFEYRQRERYEREKAQAY